MEKMKEKFGVQDDPMFQQMDERNLIDLDGEQDKEATPVKINENQIEPENDEILVIPRQEKQEVNFSKVGIFPPINERSWSPTK